MKPLVALCLLISVALNVAALTSEHRSASGSRGDLPTGPVGATPTAAPRRESARRTAVNPLLAAFDADGDGKLSAAEIARASELLRMLDANHDGVLTADEIPLPPGWR